MNGNYSNIVLTTIFFIAGILFSGSALSQFNLVFFRNDASVLYTKIPDASESQLMTLYNQLAFYYAFDNPDSCFKYSELALELALKRKDSYEEASAYRHMGNAYNLLNDYKTSVFYLQKALDIFKAIEMPRNVLEVLTDLSKVNYDANLYDRVMELNEEGYQLLIKHSNTDTPLITPFEGAILLGLKAISCREAKEYGKGIEFFRDYLSLSKHVRVPAPAHEIYLASLADIFTRTGQFDSALKYTFLAQQYMLTNLEKPSGEFTGYEYELGALYMHTGNNEKALRYLLTDLKKNHKSGSYRYAAISATRIGDIYLEAGQHDSAYLYYTTALKDAKQFQFSIRQDQSNPEVYSGYQYFYHIGNLEMKERYLQLMVRVHQRLYNYYREVSDLAKALDHQDDLMLYRDSTNTIMSNLEVKRMQLQFDTEQIEKENILLQRDNELKESKIRQNQLIFIIIVVVAILIMVVGFAFFRHHRLKILQKSILLEHRLLRAQMNPHFIFNSLASVQNLIFKKDEMKASVYLSNFSDLVRNILEHSSHESITLEREISTIRNYLELQQVRFQGKFDYSISVDETIDTELTNIPPMLAQPFIENSIEHGIKHRETPGHIWIRYRKNPDGLWIEIEDNGVGRTMAKELEASEMENHLSVATNITRERLNVLNKRSKEKIRMEIIDIKDDTGKASGTMVRFFIA